MIFYSDDIIFNGGKFYKSINDVLWMLIYFYNSDSDDYFVGSSDALYSPCSSPSGYNCNKYSIIGSIDDNYRINDKFEFLLEYPSLAGFNQWLQTINLANETETFITEGKPSTEYEPISINFHTRYCGGLVKNLNPNTDIDGSTHHEYWYYSIAPYKYNKKQYPGPNLYDIYMTYLWLRVNPITNFLRCADDIHILSCYFMHHLLLFNIFSTSFQTYTIYL